MSACTNPDLGVLLHAYELHALSEQETERFELHLLECEYCFQQASSFESHVELMRKDDAVKEVLTAPLENRPHHRKLADRIRAYLWPPVPLIFRPALVYLLLLMMLIPVYYGLMDSGGDIRPAQMLTLFPNRSSDLPVISRSSGWDGTIAFIFSGAVSDRGYQVAIKTEDGHEVKRFDDFRFDHSGFGAVIFPFAKMRPGDYRLIITDTNGEYPSNTQEYFFRIEE